MKHKVSEISPVCSMLRDNISRSKSIYNIKWMEPWEEIIGKVNGFSSDDIDVWLKIDDHVLSFIGDSTEASCIKEFLNEAFLGRVIAILKTDIPEKPIKMMLPRIKARVKPSFKCKPQLQQ